MQSRQFRRPYVVLLSIASVAIVACGPSPARGPTRFVRVPVGEPPPACDDDDEMPITSTHAKPVEYVPIDAWQAPQRVQEFESKVIPRGNAKPDYIQFPKLTLHKPIPETRSSRGYGW
jgi:hypothetical protein